MDKTIKKLKLLWKDTLYKSMLPTGNAEVTEGIHYGMFEIHGHRIDSLTELIESLEM